MLHGEISGNTATLASTLIIYELLDSLVTICLGRILRQNDFTGGYIVFSLHEVLSDVPVAI